MSYLLRCVRLLGINKGFRYWRITRACRRHPGLALHWADALETEADSGEANGVTKYAAGLRGFAREIRLAHSIYTQTNKS
jgi:hypothetical protein